MRHRFHHRKTGKSFDGFKGTKRTRKNTGFAQHLKSLKTPSARMKRTTRRHRR